MDSHRLANGLLFGLPVVLDTERDDITLGDRVLLTYNGEVGNLFWCWLCCGCWPDGCVCCSPTMARWVLA